MAGTASGQRVSSRSAAISPELSTAVVSAAVEGAREWFLKNAGDVSRFNNLPASTEAAKELALERREQTR